MRSHQTPRNTRTVAPSEAGKIDTFGKALSVTLGLGLFFFIVCPLIWFLVGGQSVTSALYGLGLAAGITLFIATLLSISILLTMLQRKMEARWPIYRRLTQFGGKDATAAIPVLILLFLVSIPFTCFRDPSDFWNDVQRRWHGLTNQTPVAVQVTIYKPAPPENKFDWVGAYTGNMKPGAQLYEGFPKPTYYGEVISRTIDITNTEFQVYRPNGFTQTLREKDLTDGSRNFYLRPDDPTLEK